MSTISECPCCASTELTETGIGKSYWVNPLSKRVAYTYALCDRCGFYFTRSPLPQEELETYYERSETLRSQEVDAVERVVFEDQSNFMARQVPLAGRRVLEVGCDTAKFLDFIHEARGAETYFDEKSEVARALITRKALHRPTEAHPDLKYDFIVLRHVLEHIVEPARWLGTLTERLAAGGRFFIEVPDWTYVDAFTDAITFEHVSSFTLGSLTLLLERVGLIVTDLQFTRTPGYPTTSNRVLRVLAEARPGGTQRSRQEAVRENFALTYGNFYRAVEELRRQSPTASIALYAASWFSQDLLHNSTLGPQDVVAIFDSDPRKHFTDFFGLQVLPASEVQRVRPDVMLVLSSYEDQIADALVRDGYLGRIIKLSALMRGHGV